MRMERRGWVKRQQRKQELQRPSWERREGRGAGGEESRRELELSSQVAEVLGSRFLTRNGN